MLPDMVQIGNEINSGLVNGADWPRLGPRPPAAARRASTPCGRWPQSTGQPIEVMLHVAQPENALDWFEQAADVGLTDFDVIGLSYYPQWSSFTPAELGSAVQTLATAYGKDVLVVETGYPWTSDAAGDTADNVLDQALRVYEVTPAGQARFMSDLTAHRRRQRRTGNGVLGAGVVEHRPVAHGGGRVRTGRTPRCSTSTATLHAGADYLAGDYERARRRPQRRLRSWPSTKPATSTTPTPI